MAAMGILAVMILLASAANFSSQNAYFRTGDSERRAQAEILFRDTLTPETLNLIGVENKEIYSLGNPAKDLSTWKVEAMKTSGTLQADHPVYPALNIDYKDGDILIAAWVTQNNKKRTVKIRKIYLWNKNGRFKRPVAIHKDL